MYILTGGAGFIGSVFLAKLNSEGVEDVIVVDELGNSLKWENLVSKSYKDYLHKNDFIDLLEQGFFKNQLTSIIHMGACSSTTEDDGDYLMENNFKYTRRLAEHCMENNVRFIYASSAATYGNGEHGYSDNEESTSNLRPTNRYGYSKQLFDLWAIKGGHTDKLAGFKFFNVYGPNEYHKKEQRSVVSKCYQWIKESGKATLFKSYRDDYEDGKQMRDHIYVKDCVEVMWWFLNNPGANGIFNLGTGKARTWLDLAHAVFAALDLEPKIEFIEMPENLRNHYQYFTQADIAKLESTGCQIKFNTLEDGVRDYVKGYLEKDLSCI